MKGTWHARSLSCFDLTLLKVLPLVILPFKINLGYKVNTSVATEFSSAWLSSDLARAGGLPARLGSAREVFEASSVPKILLERAEILEIRGVECWDGGNYLPFFNG